MTLSQDRLKAILNYDDSSGVFFWVKRGGKRAGHKGPRGYVKIGVGGRLYRAHRLAFLYMTGDWPKNEVDHINGDPSDNRWENLRDVTRSENLKNQAVHKNNSYGAQGVRKVNNRWRAEIQLNGKAHHIGYFSNKHEAIAARKIAANNLGFHKNHGSRETFYCLKKPASQV